MRAFLGGVVLATLAGPAAGCEDDGGADPVMLTMRHFTDGCTTPVCFCDISYEDCQQHIFEVTAQLRGDDDSELPAIRTMDLEELRAEFMATATTEGAFDPSPWDAPLDMLQLVPEGLSTTDSVGDGFLAGVAAFYSWDTREVTIISDNTPPEGLIGSVVLSHEFVHVLQDRDQGLRAQRQAWIDSSDTSTALRHLYEGEADMISTITLILGDGGADEDDFPWAAYYDALLEGMLGGLQNSPAPFLDAPFTLPYPQGGRVVRELRRDGGQARVEQVYVDGPGTSVDWIGPDAPAGRETLSHALDCVAELPGGDTRVLDADSFGALGLFGLLVGQGMTGVDALALSSHLRADMLVIFGDPAAPTDGASQSVEWRMEFETPQDALPVLRAVESAGFDIAVDGAALRLWAVGADVEKSSLTAREGCGDAAALADALAESQVRRPMDALDLRRHRRGHASPAARLAARMASANN